MKRISSAGGLLLLATGGVLADYSPISYDGTTITFTPSNIVSPFITMTVSLIGATAAVLIIGKVWSMVQSWFAKRPKT